MGKTVDDDHDRTPRPRLRTAADVVVIAATGAGLVLLVLAWGHWWPSGTEWYLTAGIGILLLVVGGLAWANTVMTVLLRRRRLARWMLAWPLVTAAGLALHYVVPPDFEDARPEFEEVAEQLLATPGPTAMYDFTIGRFEIFRANDSPDGTVYFADFRETMFRTEEGWLYAPGGVPDRDGQLTAVHLIGPWYRYTLLANW